MAEGVGGAEVLPKKTWQMLQQQMGADEQVMFCLVGQASQALAALDRRILIIKRGFQAGATFGAKVTSFTYSDITGIEVRTGIIWAWLEVMTPSFQSRTSPGVWTTNQNHDVYKLPNCLPLSKRLLPTYQPYLDRLRERIGGSKAQMQSSFPAPAASSSLASELERLAQLREAGHLTDAEYEQAKRKLLE